MTTISNKVHRIELLACPKSKKCVTLLLHNPFNKVYLTTAVELFLQNSKDLRMSSRGSCRHSHRDYSLYSWCISHGRLNCNKGSLTRPNLFVVDILNIQVQNIFNIHVQDILAHPRSHRARGCTHSNVHHSLRRSCPSAPFDHHHICQIMLTFLLTLVRKRWSLLCSYLDTK